MSERRSARTSEREWLSEIIFMFVGFTLILPLVLILSLRKLRGFLFYGFHEEKYLCLLYLVIIVLHFILLDNIFLRSYSLNDKNLTLICPAG